jgi:hypothetical protein
MDSRNISKCFDGHFSTPSSVQFIRVFQATLSGYLLDKSAKIRLYHCEYTALSRYCNTDVLCIHLSPEYLYNQ